MSEKKNKCDLNDMNVAELKKYLQERRVSVSGYFKASLVELASAVERILLPVDPNFEKDQTSNADKLIIHDMVIPDLFSLMTVNNVNSWVAHYLSERVTSLVLKTIDNTS